MNRYEKVKLSRMKNHEKAAENRNSESSYAKKKEPTREANSNINDFSNQVKLAKLRNDNAQARVKDTQRRYELFMNQQVDTSQYDFLETGGIPPEQLKKEKQILWQNYKKAQTEANQAKKNYDDLLEAYTTQMENAEKKSYEAMEMEDLNALKENQKTVVEQNQDAAIKAQNDYGVYMNQWTNTDDLDFLEENWGVTEEEKAEQKALLQRAYTATGQLTDSRESLHLMEDTYNYRYDTQLLSEMSETNKIVLQLYANRYNVIGAVNTLTPEQRDRLRATGKYGQIITNPEAYLKKSGYGGEDLDRLAESFTRQKNAKKMEQVQQTAQKVGEKSGFWGTVSTYPAKLVGDVTSGLEAIDSGIKHTLGLSHYHGVDVNKPGYALSAYADIVRDSVSEDFTESAKALYNGVNYLADEMLSEAVFRGLSDVSGIKNAEKAGSTIHSMLGAYGEGVHNTALQGGATNDALGVGAASAGIDWLTNKISVDKLLETKSLKDWDQFAKTSLSGVAGSTQESLDYIGNLVIQTAALAEDSDFYRQVNALVKTGMSEEDAKKLVYAQYCSEVQYYSFLSALKGFADKPQTR